MLSGTHTMLKMPEEPKQRGVKSLRVYTYDRTQQPRETLGRSGELMFRENWMRLISNSDIITLGAIIRIMLGGLNFGIIWVERGGGRANWHRQKTNGTNRENRNEGKWKIEWNVFPKFLDYLAMNKQNNNKDILGPGFHRIIIVKKELFSWSWKD